MGLHLILHDKEQVLNKKAETDRGKNNRLKIQKMYHSACCVWISVL